MEMERAQEEKTRNERGQNAHPGKPVEMETKQWGWARARCMLEVSMSGQLGKAFGRVRQSAGFQAEIYCPKWGNQIYI